MLFDPLGDPGRLVNGMAVYYQEYLALTMTKQPAQKRDHDFGIKALLGV
jgi:hypothetical protein